MTLRDQAYPGRVGFEDETWGGGYFEGARFTALSELFGGVYLPGLRDFTALSGLTRSGGRRDFTAYFDTSLHPHLHLLRAVTARVLARAMAHTGRGVNRQQRVRQRH